MRERNTSDTHAQPGITHPDPTCADKSGELRAAMAALDAWRPPGAEPLPSRVGGARARGWVKWAAAATLVCGGFLAGQARSAPERSAAELRAIIAPELERGQAETLRQVEGILARRLEATLAGLETRHRGQLEELGQKLAASRVSDIEGFSKLLREMEARRVAETAELRRGLETVAVMTEESLAQAQRRLTTLASQRTQ
jgi:hypothetical protein